MPTDPFVDQLLSFLEQREARLLSWGFYDVSFRPGDVERGLADDAPAALRGAWDARRQQGQSAESVLEALTAAGLLYRADVSDAASVCVYRTRFAEGVRLLARLRQMFDSGQWATAPSLVGDVRVLLRPRRYPRQDQPAESCWADLAPHAPRPELQRELFAALARGRDGEALAFAGFQRRAFGRVFAEYGRAGVSGTVVCAGTGAGKTKAFYVPALVQAAAELKAPPFPKVLAIYPRNVLLADQLREALAEADKLRPVLVRSGLRPLRFGALLGQTPWHASFDQKYGKQTGATKWHGWRPVAGGFLVPFLKSPQRPDVDLVWRDDDRRAGRFCLYPADGTSGPPHVEDRVLALTRDELLREPADILFVSAEMLNREMGNPAWQRVLGLDGSDRVPRLLLLDEVHAHEGVAGAQVAWILRRWRYWARPRALHVVGLSATLRQAPRHLSLIAGLSPDRIRAFEPDEDELLSEAQEYNLAIKGDPGTGSSLLSTTIQCAMLLARLLTPLRCPPSPATASLPPEAYYGQKVFGFTDNLDVLNRWLSDLSDAERNRLLAALRLHPLHRQPPPNPPPSRSLLRQMDAEGQIWELPRRLGHDLTRPLLLGRCSSQDPGLDADRDVTVATSALEVGFDDPAVGAVLQHKSPMSVASFVQRKGRAGRRRGTRPWTVVVLSDYGRDRWNFQQVERLFEPELEELRVPVRNPYVLRIQAAYFLLDWLGRRLDSAGNRGPFRSLRGPGDANAQRRAAELLEAMLARGSVWREFHTDLCNCLRAPLDAVGRRLDDADIDALVWEAPRPLLREVVPTLLRKLQAGWTFADPALAGRFEDASYRHPLPEFLPKATFTDLDISEVLIDLPGDDGRQEFLTVGHALFETCPGRASKRFAVRVGELGYWHPFSSRLVGGELRVSLADVYPESLSLGNVGGVQVCQVERTALERHDARTLDSSYSSWEWSNHFRPEGRGRTLRLPGGTPWARFFDGVEAFLHRDGCSIEVTRFTSSCRYELQRVKQDPVRGRVVLERSGEGDPISEGVGFRQGVDGLRVVLRPEALGDLPELPADVLARFRANYLLHLLQASPVLADRAGSFLIEWLWQTSLAMLTATAVRQRCTLAEAQNQLAGLRPAAARKVLRAIFQVRPGDEDGARQEQAVCALWADPLVATEVTTLEACLWAPPDDAFRDWVRRRFVATLAQAFRAAVVSREDNVAPDNLEVDVVWAGPDRAELYVTESSSGGLGEVELLWDRLRRQPSLLAEGLEHALEYCPRCQNTEQVLGIVGRSRNATPPRALARAFQAVRAARELDQADAARRRLRAALEREGFAATRAVLVGLQTRILRPGSSPATDGLLAGLNRLWRRRERNLAVGIDARVFAYHCVEHARVRRRLRTVLETVGGTTPTRAQLYALAQQFLLLDCRDCCPECLDQPNRFNAFGRPSRELARLVVGLRQAEVAIDEEPDSWLARARTALQVSGAVRLRVGGSGLPRLTAALPGLLAEEIETDYLLLPIRLRRVERAGRDWLLTLALEGTPHAWP